MPYETAKSIKKIYNDKGAICRYLYRLGMTPIEIANDLVMSRQLVSHYLTEYRC